MGTRIIAIGNALLDIFAFVEPDYPLSFGLESFGTSHVESSRLLPLLSGLEGSLRVAGGGAANTARAASLLGLDARFLGTVGRDPEGDFYRESLVSAGVEPLLGLSPEPTGIFLALLHGHRGRSIVVAPGAAPGVRSSRLDFERRSGDILYLDGFADGGGVLLGEEGRRAQAAGMLVALDLGSRRLVEARRGPLLAAIASSCDLVFANEDEFVALAGAGVEEGCELLAGLSCAFVVKLGERGSFYLHRGKRVESPVRAQLPLDDTGAGDAFAAGFLAARARGFPPERCLRLGNRMAEEALGVLGLGIEPERARLALESTGFF